MQQMMYPSLALIAILGAGAIRADDTQRLVNQKEWDEAVERFSQDADPKLAANKRVVMEAERAMAVALSYGGIEAVAEKFMTPNYIQHDPNIPPGRDGFARYFKVGSKAIAGSGKAPNTAAGPQYVFAQGDMVTLIFDIEMPDPTAPGKTYHYSPVAVFRIEGGKLAEHWGGQPKGATTCRPGECGEKK